MDKRILNKFTYRIQKMNLIYKVSIMTIYTKKLELENLEDRNNQYMIKHPKFLFFVIAMDDK